MTPPATAELETLAELHDRLGGVPLSRIRLHPAPGSATEADVVALLEAPRRRLCELVERTLVEKPMGYTESTLASFLIEVLSAFVRSRNLGLVSAPDGALRLWAGRVRIPDVAFISWARMPNRRRPESPLPTLAPDLAIEILSESNTANEMRQKREEYFTAGTRLVWQIDPAARAVVVFTTVDQPSFLGENDSLDGGDVLPGFMLPVRDIFGELDRNGSTP